LLGLPLAAGDVRQVMPGPQRKNQVERAQPFAGGRRIGHVAIDDHDVHSRSLTSLWGVRSLFRCGTFVTFRVKTARYKRAATILIHRLVLRDHLPDVEVSLDASPP